MIDDEYLTRVIGKVAENAVKNKIRPSQIMIGTITNTSPLTVKISDEMILPSGALIVSKEFRKITLNTTDGEHSVVFDNSLKSGEAVYLLQNMGGQQFFILGRV